MQAALCMKTMLQTPKDTFLVHLKNGEAPTDCLGYRALAPPYGVLHSKSLSNHRGKLKTGNWLPLTRPSNHSKFDNICTITLAENCNFLKKKYQNSLMIDFID